MSMRGIDVSNWDADREVILSDIDFLIAKCTEGVYFDDPTFESFVKGANECKVLTGAYHFAGCESPEDEADHFYERVKNYLNICIPFLDYEDFSKDAESVRTWCEKFIDRFYALSGVYPGIYISACLCSYFAGSWIPEKCMLWIAGYPKDGIVHEYPEEFCPYDYSPWVLPFIWQFSSLCDTAGGIFDADICYYDRQIWLQHLKKDEPLPTIPTNEDYMHEACKVILGYYGTGDERAYAVRQNGYDYAHVQNLVNEIMEVCDVE